MKYEKKKLNYHIFSKNSILRAICRFTAIWLPEILVKWLCSEKLYNIIWGTFILKWVISICQPFRVMGQKSLKSNVFWTFLRKTPRECEQELKILKRTFSDFLHFLFIQDSNQVRIEIFIFILLRTNKENWFKKNEWRL